MELLMELARRDANLADLGNLHFLICQVLVLG